MSLTTVASLVGLFFASVAAWGAVQTVRLTLRFEQDAERRRVLEALVTLKYAAHGVELASKSLELAERFRYAQAELERSLAAQLFVWDAAADQMIERLLALDAYKSPADARADADAAHTVLTSRTLPPRMPGWYIRLITWRSRRRAR